METYFYAGQNLYSIVAMLVISSTGCNKQRRFSEVKFN